MSRGTRSPSATILAAAPSYMIVTSGQVVVTTERVHTIQIGDGKGYLQYVYLLHDGRVSWHIRRRYSDFRALHKELTAAAGGAALELPPKALLSAPVDFLEDRKRKLLRYCQALADRHTTGSGHEAVLRFLGMTSPGARAGRGLMPVADAVGVEGLAIGDVVLFRCKNSAAALQRRFTNAEFDHIAVVMPHAVRDRVQVKMLKQQSSYNPNAFRSESTLILLESTTGEGVAVYPLLSRLRSYDHFDCVEYICVRRRLLSRTLSLTPETDIEKAALSFVSSVLGKKYNFNVQDVFRFYNSSTKTADGSSSSSTPESYFCSELCAAGLKALGLMRTEVMEERMYPGDFAAGGCADSLLCEGVSYGPEVEIDFRGVRLVGEEGTEGGGAAPDMGMPDAPFAPSLF